MARGGKLRCEDEDQPLKHRKGEQEKSSHSGSQSALTCRARTLAPKTRRALGSMGRAEVFTTDPEALKSENRQLATQVCGLPHAPLAHRRCPPSSRVLASRRVQASQANAS